MKVKSEISLKNISKAIGAVIAVFLLSAGSATALSTYLTSQGGTGTSSPSGILYGDNGSTSHLNTVSVGSGLTFSGGTLSATGGGGSGNVSTSTNETAGQLAYWTSNSATPALLGKVATTSATLGLGLSGALTTINNTAQSLSIATSSLYTGTTGQFPYFSGTNTLTATSSLFLATSQFLGIGTTTPKGLLGLQTATNADNAFTLSNASGANTFALSTLNSTNPILSVASSTGTEYLEVAAGGNIGVSTTSPYALLSVAGNVVIGASTAGGTLGDLYLPKITSALHLADSAGKVTAYAGTSCTNQFVRSLSAVGAATCATVANTDLANSTISGIALGSNLAALTATDSTLTFSGSYNGGTARTVGLNLANANTWTALQQFGNASTSLLSSYGPSYFGATATSSFSTAGVLSLVAGSVSTPAINFTDAATGFFRSAANAIGFAISGVEEMTLNATGLGVGSTTPSTLLSVGTPTTPGTILSAEYQPATSTSMTIDFKNGNQQLVRTGTSATSIAFTNAFPGTSLRLVVCNPGASAGALTFSGVEWAGGTAPTQTTTANQCDVWSFIVTGATSTAKIFGAASTGFN